MEFGIFTVGDLTADPTTGRTVSETERIKATVTIARHAEEPRLTVGAVAHEGPNAARLGLAGWPRSAT